MKLKITSKKDGFRRAGRAWTGQTEVDASAFDEAQIAQLKAERMLVVEEIDDAPADQAEPPADKTEPPADKAEPKKPAGKPPASK